MIPLNGCRLTSFSQSYWHSLKHLEVTCFLGYYNLSGLPWKWDYLQILKPSLRSERSGHIQCWRMATIFWQREHGVKSRSQPKVLTFWKVTFILSCFDISGIRTFSTKCFFLHFYSVMAFSSHTQTVNIKLIYFILHIIKSLLIMLLRKMLNVYEFNGTPFNDVLSLCYQNSDSYVLLSKYLCMLICIFWMEVGFV